MILYLIKSTICMALLLGVYILFLEKEKMHQFNRFYLIFGLIFSMAVPAIVIESAPSIISEPLLEFENSLVSPISVAPDEISSLAQLPLGKQPKSYTNIGLYAGILFYLLISLICFYRLMRNVYFMISKAKKENILKYEGAKIVLVKSQVIPHSFLGYMFIHESSYISGKIDKEVFQHELAHIKQRHSIDILFVEILKIVFWFNPVLHYYKKAMQLNHEFLADQSVINLCYSISDYQNLLLNQIGLANNPALASSLNYSLTKKRLTMMNKKTSRIKALLTQAMIMPLLATFVFVFSTKVEAQDQKTTSGSKLIDDMLELAIKPSPTDDERKKLSNIVKVILDSQRELLELDPDKKYVFSARATITNDIQRNYVNLVRIYNTKNKEYESSHRTNLLNELKAIHSVFTTLSESINDEWKRELVLKPVPLPESKPGVERIDRIPLPPPSGNEVIVRGLGQIQPTPMLEEVSLGSEANSVLSAQEHINVYNALSLKYTEYIRTYLNDGKTDAQLKNVLRSHDNLKLQYELHSKEIQSKIKLPVPPPAVMKD